MQQPHQKRWLVFWLCFSIACGGLFVVNAALLDLDAFVTFSIFDENGPGPFNVLPDGAFVQIVGSFDNVVLDPGGMRTQGTNLLYDSVSGDDVILGTVRIGDNNSSNGTFTTTVKYNPDDVQYAYIRFYNWTNPVPVTGMVYWGTSAIFELVPTLGVARVDFNPNQTLETGNLNNFVIIPEPGTANLMLLFFAVMGGIRARMKRQQHKDARQTQDQA